MATAKRARRAPRVAPSTARTIVLDVVENDEWRDALIDATTALWSVRSVRISGCVLRGVRFTGAELVQVELDNTVLEDCDLSGAVADGLQLVQCELRGCRLDGIDAGRNRWSDVALVDCSLRDASLRSSRWQRVDVTGSVAVGADLSGLECEHVTFTRCDLSGVQFWHASLAGTSFPGCQLEGVRGGTAFRGTRLEATQILDVAPTVFEGLGIEIVDG